MAGFNDEKLLRIVALFFALSWFSFLVDVDFRDLSLKENIFYASYIFTPIVVGILSYRLGYNGRKAIGLALATLVLPIVGLLLAFMGDDIQNLIKDIKDYDLILQKASLEYADILEISIKKSKAESELINKKNKYAATYLIRALNDDDRRIREMLIAALENIKEPRAIEPLIRISKEDVDAEVRERAVEALNKIQGSMEL